jgi:hypothetical protein
MARNGESIFGFLEIDQFGVTTQMKLCSIEILL